MDDDKIRSWDRIKFWFFALLGIAGSAYIYWTEPPFSVLEKLILVGIFLIAAAGMLLNAKGAGRPTKKHF